MNSPLSGGGGGGGSGGSGRDPFEILSTVQDTIQDMGWTGLGQSILGTIAVTIAFSGLDLLNALINIPISIFNTLATVVPALNQATFGGLAGFVASSFGAGANAFGSGWVGMLGILQTPLGIAVALFVLWEVLYFMDYVDSDVLGLVIDAPFLSSDESEAAGDET